jgi:DHA3 family tetracycline resistance protein-like MFS transporter
MPKPDEAPGRRMTEPFRIRDFRLLWVGMSASLLGDGVFLVALAWQVYELSNKASALSLVGVAMSVPHVALLLIGGVLSDRFPRRVVMLVADLLRGLAIGALGVLSITGGLRMGHVLALVAVYGAGMALFGPAFDAIVPDIVPSGLLAQANALDLFVRPAALRLAGPALGGWLIAAAGPGGAFLLDAATFAVSIGCLLALRPPASPQAGEGSVLRQILEGFRYVRGQVWLWGTFLAATVAYLLFMGPTEVLLPFVVKNDLAGDAGELGLVFAFGGVGALGAALLVGHLGMPRRSMVVMYTCWAAATFTVAAYGLAGRLWQVMAASLVFNALETAGTVIWATTKHRLIPAALLGRVSSLDWFISLGLLPLSFALTGIAAGVFGARGTLVGAGMLGGAVTLAFLFLPGMRAIQWAGEQRTSVPGEA